MDFNVGDRVSAKRPNGDTCLDGEIIYLYRSNREALVRGEFEVTEFVKVFNAKTEFAGFSNAKYKGDFICGWETMEQNDPKI